MPHPIVHAEIRFDRTPGPPLANLGDLIGWTTPDEGRAPWHTFVETGYQTPVPAIQPVQGGRLGEERGVGE